MILTTAIPVYNGAKTITRALTSLYTSEKQPDRVVVLDDGSTDDTVEMVDRFRMSCGGWEALEVMRFDNAGYVGNSNRALQLAAETDYLHILHADDEVGRYFYAKAVPSLRRGPGLAFSQPIIWNDSTNQITWIKGERRFWTQKEFIKARRDLDHIYYCGTLLRTERNGIHTTHFQEHFPQICDQVFWAQWVKSCDAQVVELDPYLCTYHQRDDSWTASQKRDMPKLVNEEWSAVLRLSGELRKDDYPIVPTRSKCLFACRSVVKAIEVRYGYYASDYHVANQIGKQKADSVRAAAVDKVGRGIWLLACLIVLARKKWRECAI